MNTAKMPPKENVTDGALRIIEEVVQKTELRDRNELLDKVCAELEDRFVGDSLEYHLDQMHINTTSDILYAIDLYFTMMEMFPGTSFRRGEANPVSA